MTAGLAPAALTVAVLGLGEAGGTIARDLAAAGVQVRGYDPGRAGATRRDAGRQRRGRLPGR